MGPVLELIKERARETSMLTETCYIDRVHGDG